ncbi:hypothetical protein [Methanoregula sp.]|uniref:hypothetical protein n=2 Tax=Methanoregula sp. TaxID=2052170 RepID=UPI003C78F799
MLQERTPDKPYTPFAGDIPTTRTEMLSLLRREDDDLDRLSPTQLAAIRRLYLLDDDRTVAERIQNGDITAGMEDETAAINKFQREEEA